MLSGMGELHLEIIHDRLKRDFGVDCCLGKLQVSYKEQPTAPVTHTGGCGHVKVGMVLDMAELLFNMQLCWIAVWVQVDTQFP